MFSKMWKSIAVAVCIFGVANAGFSSYGPPYSEEDAGGWGPPEPPSHSHHSYHHHHSHAPVYVAKSPVYFPSVFSEPLPIVPLPSLPAEFFNLKSAVNSGVYGGSENEVPSKKKSKKGKKNKISSTTPPPEEEEDEEEETEDQQQETEGDVDSEQGGYASGPSGRTRQREGSSSAEGGYSSGQPEVRQKSRQRDESGPTEGGYPSSNDDMRSSGRGRQEDNEDIGETEAEDDDSEIMTTGEDDDSQNNAAESEDDDQEEVGRGRSGNRKSKKDRRNNKKKNRKSKGSDEEEEYEISSDRPLIPSIFSPPLFGSGVLNTVYPAYSQQALLKALNGGGGGDEGYPESGQDISAISITEDGDSKSAKKSKKKKTTSRRKNRPASRSRQGRRGKSSARRDREENKKNQRNNEPQQQYAVPIRSSGLNPPTQNNNQDQGGYRVVNNEMRQRTSDTPQQFRDQGPSQQYGQPSGSRNYQQPQQQYGAPSSSNFGGVSGQSFQDSSQLIEPRQMSQGTFLDGRSQLTPDGNLTPELIRTVETILQKYPN